MGHESKCTHRKYVVGTKDKGKAKVNQGVTWATQQHLSMVKQQQHLQPRVPLKEYQGANPGVAFATVATTGGVSRLPMHHEHKDHMALRFPCDFDATKGDTSRS